MFLYPWGDMHSLNLGWFLLQFRFWVKRIEEYLDNGGGTAENLANIIAPIFNAANSYGTGDYVLYNDELYKANQPVNPGTWNPDAWDPVLLTDELNNTIDPVARLMIAGNYSSSFPYQKYAICRHDDKLYMANTNLPAGGEAWDPTHWDEITVGAGLTGLKRSDDTLAAEIAKIKAYTNGEEIKVVAGCLRQDENGWFVYNEDAHKPINIQSVEVDENGDLVLYYGFQGTKICSIVAVTDETFAEKYNVGTSVSGNLAKVRFWRKPYTIGGVARFASGSWDYSSSDFQSLTTASGVITLTYKTPLTNIVSQKDAFEISVQSNKYPVIIDEITRQYIRFHMIDASGNTITSMPSGTEFYINKPINGYQVNASSTEFNIANANIWILGFAITTPNP